MTAPAIEKTSPATATATVTTPHDTTNPLASTSMPATDRSEAQKGISFEAAKTERTPTEEVIGGISEAVAFVSPPPTTPKEGKLNQQLVDIPGVCGKPNVKIIDPTPGHVRVALTEPLQVSLTLLGQQVNFTIPKGFVTDLASIPKGIHSILPPWGDYASAAIIHDYLYENAPQGVSRLQSDLAFFSCMGKSDVSWGKRLLLTSAVMLMGGAPWKRYRSVNPELAVA